MIRVAVVEDTDDIRESLKFIINFGSDQQCVALFSSAEEVLQQETLQEVDVVLLDINLPGMNGVECLKLLKPRYPNTQFIIFTVYEDDEHIFDALKSGATGYLLKTASSDQINAAIQEIYAGGSPMSALIARKVIQVFQQPQTTDSYALLSNREKEILDLLSQGLRYKEISDQLFVSVETVRTHVRNIYKKLEVQSRTEALNKVYRNQ